MRLTCKNGHPKTKKNWRATPSGHKYCNPCQMASNARRAERLKKLDTTTPMAATGASLPAISKDDVGGEAERVLIETMRRTKSEKTRVQVATHIRKEIAPTGGGTVAAKELAAMMAQREADMEALHNPTNLLEVIRHCQAARILPSTDESPAATPELVEAEPAPPLLLEEAHPRRFTKRPKSSASLVAACIRSNVTPRAVSAPAMAAVSETVIANSTSESAIRSVADRVKRAPCKSTCKNF